MSPQTLIFIGRSGAGKGTQAIKLINWLKTASPERHPFYVKTGEQFRQLLAGGSYTGRLLEGRLARGELMPSFLPIWVWSHLLIENLKGGEHLIFDGTPRMLLEAKILDSMIEFYERAPATVINLAISRETAVERLESRGRGDDELAAINRRLDWFESETEPVLRYFKESPLYRVVAIDGEQDIEAIHQDIISQL